MTAGAPRPPESYTRQERVYTLVAVLTALALAGLDNTIVATAGPEIQRDLRIPAALYAWITTAYLVASTVMMPIYGKLSDLYGRKPILLFGVGVFLLGSATCGLAPTTAVLIAGRAVQGLGAASLFTTTLVVIADLFPPETRGKYMGLIGGVMGVSSVVGPLLGGIITDTLGWHWVFFINLPVGAVAVWIIITRMPALGRRPSRHPVDVAGAVWLVTGLVPLLVALSLAGERSGGVGGAGADATPLPPAALAAMAALGVVGLAGFFRAERRAADPIVPFRLFRDRTVAFATSAMFVLGAAFLFSMIFLPLYLVNVVGVSATSAGLTMVPLTMGMVAGSVGSGQLVSRVGHWRRLLLASLALLAGAFALMGVLLTPETSYATVTGLMVLVGLGIGPSLPLYTLVVQNEVALEDLGVATAVSTFSRMIGQVVGVTVFGAIFGLVASGRLHEPVALTEAIRLLYRIGIGLVIVGFGLTAAIAERPLRAKPGHVPVPAGEAA